MTNKGLYRVIFAKKELPTVPKPRAVKTSPPLQHIMANIAEKTDETLINFSFKFFIIILLNNIYPGEVYYNIEVIVIDRRNILKYTKRV